MSLPPRSTRRELLLVSLLVVAYFATGRLGLAVAYNSVATLLWAPSGIAVAALWLGGRRLALGVALGAFVTNLSIGAPPILALTIALGNTAEALLADVLVERAGLRRGLHTVRDVVTFVGLVVAVSTTVAAANAAVWLTLLTHQPVDRLLTTALVWWLGDAGGVLVVTPLILAFARPAVTRPVQTSEGALVAVLAPAFASISFGLIFPGATSSAALMLLPFPVLAWAALRFGLRGATGATALVTAAAVAGTAAHTGPFRSGNAHVDAAGLWCLLATLSVTAMLLATGFEERHLEAERRIAAERRLEAGRRLTELGLLAGGIAHDFNNLLMAVRANVAIVRLDDARFTREAIDSIDEAAVRAAELTDSLLAYAGRRPMQRRDIDLSKLAAETLRMLGSILRPGVAVTLECEPGLPAVTGDPGQLRQVMMNLLLNATQAIESDGAVTVRLSADRASARPRVLLEVRDDGCGMDEETVARIFQPFFTTKEQGRGLGLAAVLGIVHAHSGQIDIDSRPGRGTVASVVLPASERAVEVAEATRGGREREPEQRMESEAPGSA